MLIIIEGVDRTGKSTLARRIADRIGADVRHYSKPERHPLAEYERDLDDYVPGSGRHVVIDRFHWGETIWPELFRRPTEFTDEMFYHVELFLQSRGALMIHATADPDQLRRRFVGEPLDPELIEPAVLAFRDVTARTSLPVLGYDFARPGAADVPDLAVFGAGKLEEYVGEPWRVTSHWVGSPKPNLLLVGDEPGPPARRDPDSGAVPFRPYPATSGAYLMAALRRTNYFPAITNARTRDGTEVPLRDLWLALERPRVVALGNVADAALSAAEVAHGVAPHPQYVRRFFHARTSDYIRLIRRAAGGRDTRGELKR